MLNIVMGCLVGGALGDALGWPIEFMRAEQIRQSFGDTPQLVLRGGVAEITDDTQMTLFTIDALLELDAEQKKTLGIFDLRFRRAYLDWYLTQTQEPEAARRMSSARLRDERLFARRAPGSTCMSSLAAGGRGSNNSKGCGANMRVAPIGLYASSLTEAFEYGRRSASITHGHPEAADAAGLTAAYVWCAARRLSVYTPMTLLRSQVGENLGLKLEHAIRLGFAGAHGPTPQAAIDHFGEGWVADEALAIALYAYCRYLAVPFDGVKDALWIAVAHDGDSDSTGAIAGNLIGAHVGYKNLPADWCAKLELHDLIIKMGTQLNNVMQREVSM